MSQCDSMIRVPQREQEEIDLISSMNLHSGIIFLMPKRKRTRKRIGRESSCLRMIFEGFHHTLSF